MRRRLPLLLLALGACASPADEFVSGRLLDPCNGSWPVCTTTAGCFAGNASYLQGQFPGTRRFIVRTEGQANVTLSLFLESQGATGETLRLEWNDAACGMKEVEEIDGRAFFKEAEARGGTLSRTRGVHAAGDHLIEVSSDATARYLLKAEIAEATSD